MRQSRLDLIMNMKRFTQIDLDLKENATVNLITLVIIVIIIVYFTKYRDMVLSYFRGADVKPMLLLLLTLFSDWLIG